MPETPSTVVRVIDPSAGGVCNERQTPLRWKDGISGPVADSDRLDGKDASEFVQNGQGAGGDLTGSYPAPTVRPGAIGPSQVGVMPSVRVRSDTDQEIPSTTILTPVSFDRELWDTAGMADLVADDEGLTVRTSGKYLITGQISWLGGAGGGSRTALISVAGVFPPGATTTVSGVPGQSAATVVTAIAHVNAGSKIGLRAAQTSGSALRLNRFHTNGAASLAAHWIGP